MLVVLSAPICNSPKIKVLVDLLRMRVDPAPANVAAVPAGSEKVNCAPVVNEALPRTVKRIVLVELLRNDCGRTEMVPAEATAGSHTATMATTHAHERVICGPAGDERCSRLPQPRGYSRA
jgi:hypothetical protein